MIKGITRVSVVIRTLNESRHLPELLRRIGTQDCPDIEIETVVVDSGSTDGTVEIAQSFGARVIAIRKEEFSFGRSLNYGCREARGNVLVIVSGHCIPTSNHWIRDLIAPLGSGDIVYTYGGQVGNEDSYFSERRIFQKYFPAEDHVPQEGFYCNNANSALLKSVWVANPFDESLTGLEDMHLARRLVEKQYRIAYVASACVEHLHDESWAQIKRRFEREAIALQFIMPEVHLSVLDATRYFVRATIRDCLQARLEGTFFRNVREIVLYRFMQFLGSYRGNQIHRQVSQRRKEQYFYPNRKAQSHPSRLQQRTVSEAENRVETKCLS